MRSILRAVFLRAVLAVSLIVLPAGLSHAQGQGQAYPNRPVRIVVPFAPGGVTDVMARLLAQKLSESLGKEFFVDNRAGAGGNIGTGVAAMAPADGYTLVLTSSSYVINPSIHAKIPYDPEKDLTPVTISAVSPNIVTVNPSLPVRSIAELITYVRQSGKASFASAGVATTPHLSGELFRLSLDLDMVHVPFGGAGPALQSAIAGHTPIAFTGFPPAVPLVRAGSLRALAVTSARRLAAHDGGSRCAGSGSRDHADHPGALGDAQGNRRAPSSRDRPDHRAAGNEAAAGHARLRAAGEHTCRLRRANQARAFPLGQGGARRQDRGAKSMTNVHD
jgi:tripartite-type tricarboxylate transporter receptor subunit TctC